MSGSNPNYGTKVADPSRIIRENPGPIASDSLAAESAAFAENRNAQPSGVSGASSTFANTDTSGATRLDPASDAEARKAKEDWAHEKSNGSQATSYPTAMGGQNGNATRDRAYKTGFGTTGGRSGGTGVDEAPSYVNSQYVDVAGPKGKGLKEGGFTSSDAKNASFTSEIGGKNDPGRLAEAEFARANAGDAGVPMQKGGLGDNLYENLERDA